MRLTRQTLIATLAMGAASMAATSATDAIKARQQTMESIGDALGSLAAIAKKEAPFDAAVVEKSAGTIAKGFEKAATLFPPGSGEGDVETWAKPEIWSDRAAFEEKLNSARAAAVELQAVKEEAAFRPALGKLGGNCKACHDGYRRPKE